MGSFMETNDNHDKNNHHHHSNHQIQRLQAYFNKCPNLDNWQRRKLGEELNLKPKQIKLWFQNKRTQSKIYHQKEENELLRAEDMKIIYENETMDDALRTVICPPCGGRRPRREAQLQNLQDLRSENHLLRENSELMILQDGFIDALGGMLVYAPLDLNSANSAISGEVDPSTIAILPSGFIISRDSRPFPGDLDGSRMTLLTVAFQILASGPTYSSGLRMEESTATVNTLISSTSSASDSSCALMCHN